MANLERGAYEPRADNVRSFDIADEDDPDDIEEGSRLPLLIVIALLVLAAFAGVVWLAYTQGVQRGRADAPRLIAAEPGPIRIAPSSPGGVQTPYTGLKIYQQPAPADATEATDSDQSSRTGVTAVPSSPPALRPSANTPQEAVAPNTTDQQPSGPAVPKPAAAAPKMEPQAPSVVGKEASATQAPAPAANPLLHTGSYVLQIGSYKSQMEAEAAWQAFQAKHPVAGGYRSDVKEVILGEKGTWYRLRLGSFPDKTAAVTFCEKLKADGGNCFLAK
jgi:cell division protein FtsN